MTILDFLGLNISEAENLSSTDAPVLFINVTVSFFATNMILGTGSEQLISSYGKACRRGSFNKSASSGFR